MLERVKNLPCNALRFQLETRQIDILGVDHNRLTRGGRLLRRAGGRRVVEYLSFKTSVVAGHHILESCSSIFLKKCGREFRTSFWANPGHIGEAQFLGDGSHV